jgi:hypothetical protein
MTPKSSPCAHGRPLDRQGAYDGGDRVLPMSYNGRTGRWCITGASRPAVEVKAERENKRTDARQLQAELAIAATASKSPTSLTRAELGNSAGVGSACHSACSRS